MNQFKFLALFLFLSLSIVSCSKDDTGPTITITAPAEGAILIRGQEYSIEGTVTDYTEIATINAGGLNISPLDSKTKHTFKNLKLPIPLTAVVGNGTFTITATDKESNQTTKVVNFKIQ